MSESEHNPPAFIHPQITPELGVDDDTVMDLVRGTRLSILKAQTAQGVPLDTDSWGMMHQNLQELERGALAKKRLAQDDKDGDAQIALGREIAKAMILGMGGGRDIYASKDGNVGSIPDPSKEIAGTATIAPGELHIGDDTGKFDDFQATVGKQFEDARRAAAADLDKE